MSTGKETERQLETEEAACLPRVLDHLKRTICANEVLSAPLLETEEVILPLAKESDSIQLCYLTENQFNNYCMFSRNKSRKDSYSVSFAHRTSPLKHLVPQIKCL